MQALSLAYTAVRHRSRCAAVPEKRAAAASDKSEPGKAASPAHEELLFVLERRGSGWGEEVLPHLSVVRRPVARARAEKRDAGSGQLLLREAGLSQEAVADIVGRATAWRVRCTRRRALVARAAAHAHGGAAHRRVVCARSVGCDAAVQALNRRAEGLRRAYHRARRAPC